MIFSSRTGGNARIIPSWCLGKILRLRWSLVPVLRWRRRPVGSGSGTPCTTPDHLCRTRGPTTELRPFLGKRRRDIQGGRSGMVFLRHFEGHCSWIVAANCPRHSIYPLTSYRRFGNSFLHMLPEGPWQFSQDTDKSAPLPSLELPSELSTRFTRPVWQLRHASFTLRLKPTSPDL
jgi:hypothetical protein